MRQPVEHSPTPYLSGKNNDILIKLRKLKQFPKSAPNFMALYTRVIFTYQELICIKKFLTMWTLAMLKDFNIAPCMRKIGMPKLLTLGMNNPVAAEDSPGPESH